MSFNPAAYLYYYPELASSNVTSVEAAYQHYTTGGDPDNMYQDLVDLGLNYALSGGTVHDYQVFTVRGALTRKTYSNLFPAADFPGKLFLLRNISLSDSNNNVLTVAPGSNVHLQGISYSPINADIKTSMLAMGHSEDALHKQGVVLDIIRAPVTCTSTDHLGDGVYTFGYTTKVRGVINSNTLGPGDRILMTLDATGTTFYADVLDIDFATRRISTRPVFSAPLPPGKGYTLQGIQVVDVERLGRINYVRMTLSRLRNNQLVTDPTLPFPSQMGVGGWDPDFNYELYQVLYPDARTLSREQCYLDYMAHVTKNPMRIGFASEITMTSNKIQTVLFQNSVEIGKDLTVKGIADFQGPEVIVNAALTIADGAMIRMPQTGLLDANEGEGRVVMHATGMLLSNTSSNEPNTEITLYRESNDTSATLSLVGTDDHHLLGSRRGDVTLSVRSNGNAVLMGVDAYPGTMRIDGSGVKVDGNLDVVSGTFSMQQGSNSSLRAALVGSSNGSFAITVSSSNALLVGNEGQACALAVQGSTVSVNGSLNLPRDGSAVIDVGGCNVTLHSGGLVMSNVGAEFGVTITSNGSAAMTASSNVSFGVQGKGHTLSVQESLVTVEGRVEAKEYYTLSDKRAKTDIQVVDDALEKLCRIHGYTFRHKHSNSESEKQVGLLAQEVQYIMPELVHTDSQGMLSVAYGNMAGLFVEAIRSLDERLRSLSLQLRDCQLQASD
jgi:hypothetical protein